MDFKGIETDVGLIGFEWFWRLERFAISPCIKQQKNTSMWTAAKGLEMLPRTAIDNEEIFFCPRP